MYAYRIIQDIQDKEQALLRAAAGMGSTTAFDPVTFRQKSIEEIAAGELVKIRAERIEREAEEDASKAYAQARERGIARAGAPVVETPTPSPTPLPKNKRRDEIWTVIEKAQREVSDPFDTVGIWLKLCEWVQAEKKPYPVAHRQDGRSKRVHPKKS